MGLEHDAPQVAPGSGPIQCHRDFEGLQAITTNDKERVLQQERSPYHNHWPPYSEPGPDSRKKRRRLICVVALAIGLFIVALAVGIGVGISVARNNSQQQAQAASAQASSSAILSATASATATPTSSFSATATASSSTSSVPSATKSAVTSGVTGIASLRCNDSASDSYTASTGAVFIEECHAGYPSGEPVYNTTTNQTIVDLVNYIAYSFESCLENCATFNLRPTVTTLCKAVTFNANLTSASIFNSGNCFLKNARGVWNAEPPFGTGSTEVYALYASAYLRDNQT